MLVKLSIQVILNWVLAPLQLGLRVNLRLQDMVYQTHESLQLETIQLWGFGLRPLW